MTGCLEFSMRHRELLIDTSCCQVKKEREKCIQEPRIILVVPTLRLDSLTTGLIFACRTKPHWETGFASRSGHPLIFD